tara:strand:- start:179 stop:649 length:471 start_codon:yes stop_codon:yes gene_type:complete
MNNNNEYKTCPDCCYDILDDEGDVMDHECISDNEMIAEFMGWKRGKNEETNTNQYFLAQPEHWYLKDENELEYHTSWDWLMPVILKLSPLTECGIKIQRNETIESAYSFVVKFIKEHNEVNRLVDLSKYICGSCGDRVNTVAFNEDKDVDECVNCM